MSFKEILLGKGAIGRSRCDEGAEQARHFADDLAAVLDDAHIDRAALVCQSMGGWTGLQFARRYPERVTALVFSGTPAGVLTPKVLEALRAVATTAAQMERIPAWNEAHPALAADIFERDAMRGFLYVEPEGIASAEALAVWVGRAVAFAESQPSKPSRPRRRKPAPRRVPKRSRKAKPRAAKKKKKPSRRR